MLLLQSSVLLLVLSGAACTVEVNGEDQVVAVEAQNMSPVQMGNIRVSDLLAGLIQGNVDHWCHAACSPFTRHVQHTHTHTLFIVD